MANVAARKGTLWIEATSLPTCNTQKELAGAPLCFTPSRLEADPSKHALLLQANSP